MTTSIFILTTFIYHTIEELGAIVSIETRPVQPMTILSSVMRTVKEWFGKYLYFSKATMCIRGLVFSQSLVDHAIMSILIMSYLNYEIWVKQHFQIAAVVTNVRDGLSSIMVIVLAHLPHTYKGYFKIIVTTSAAYVVGLGILWRSAMDMHSCTKTAARLCVGAVVLLTLGEAGRSAALNEFLDEQYLSEQDQTECIDDKKLQDRRKALWSLPWFLGAVVAFSLKATTWEQTFKISTIVMGVFYLFFWFGYSYYFICGKSVIEAKPVHPIEEAEKDETCIDTEENHIEHVEEICNDTEENYIEQVQSLEICIDTEELAAKPVRRGKFWGVIKKMKDRKHFRNEILAIWLTFLVYSVVTAAGNTFFFEQMDSFQDLPIKPIAIIFYELDSLSKYITSHLWESLPKKWKSNTRVRIGCGMVCTVLCCVAAWQVEIRRLNEAKRQRVKDDPSKAISMSIFWLVPQFSLLGIMQGLAEDGLIDFFVDRVAGDDDKAVVRYYASHTTDFVIGVGKLLTALTILAFRRRWFSDSIYKCHLDKYYRALTFMSVVGFYFYVCVSTYYCTNDASQDSAREENEINSDRIG